MDNSDRVPLNLPGFVLLGATTETNIQIGGNGAEYLFELPEAGLVGNDVRLRVTTSRNRNDLVEQLLWSQVLQSPAVGSFYSDTAATQTQVRWEKEPGRPRLEAGQAMSVRLSFYPHMRLYLKDSVSLTLPGFTATSGPVALILSEGSSQFFTAVLSLLALLVQKYKY